jgi:hypothetical protein
MPISSNATTTPTFEKTPPFSVGQVESTKPPSEGAGKYWCKYTIVQGTNTITGYRQGGVKAVRKAVGEIVADMNQRRMGKRGRVHLTPSSKPKANTNTIANTIANTKAKAK